MRSFKDMQQLFNTAASGRREGESTDEFSAENSKCNKNSVSLRATISYIHHVLNHASVILLSHKITTRNPLTREAVRSRNRTQPQSSDPFFLNLLEESIQNLKRRNKTKAHGHQRLTKLTST
jgi:hypothetical protein